jgi:hypothetical protein
MGIKIEFNPDIALRNISEFREGNRKESECIPELLETGKTYPFLKEGQRNYWFGGEIALLETKGNEVLSDPVASIIVEEATHFKKDGKVYTKGSYKVTEVFNDKNIHFNWLNIVRE